MSFRTASLPRGRELFERMKRLGEPTSQACRHCGADRCPCGQAEMSEAVDAAVLLPKPSGNYLASKESEAMCRSIPIGPRYTRAQAETLARGAADLASYYRLISQAGEAGECEVVVGLARAAAAKLP